MFAHVLVKTPSSKEIKLLHKTLWKRNFFIMLCTFKSFPCAQIIGWWILNTSNIFMCTVVHIHTFSKLTYVHNTLLLMKIYSVTLLIIHFFRFVKYSKFVFIVLVLVVARDCTWLNTNQFLASIHMTPRMWLPISLG